MGWRASQQVRTLFRMRGIALVAGAALLTGLAPTLHGQEPPPPPPPPPVTLLPPISVPTPPPLGPVSGALPGAKCAAIDPAPSANPFAPLLPPPAGKPLASTPPLLVDFWAIGQQHLSGSSSNFAISEFSIGYDFRYPIGPFTFGARPQFEVVFLSGPTYPGPDLPAQTYGLSVNLEAEFRFDQRFSIRGAITPGLYTDFSNLTGHAFRIPAQVVGAYAINPRIVAVAGVMYTAQPSLSVLPVAGAIWTPSDDWRFELIFPRVRVIRHLDETLNVYGTFGVQGETYAVRSAGFDDVFQYRDVRLGFGAEWTTPIRASLFFEAGVSLIRRITFENQPGSDVNSGLYLRVGGRY